MMRAPLAHMVIFLLALAALLAPADAFAQRKVALIIGNGAYTGPGFGQLATPAEDAGEMDRTLSALGYETLLLTDASRESILDAVHSFEGLLRGADVGVFYYSGHGVCIGGENYMVPCGIRLHPETLSDECVRIRNVQTLLRKSCRLSFLFIDACRNNPMAEDGGALKSIRMSDLATAAQARDDRPAGQMIFYATENGSAAATGYGRLSPFTEVLVRHLFDREEFRSVVPLIEADVVAACGQHPVVEGTYSSNWHFNPSAADRPGWMAEEMVRPAASASAAAASFRPSAVSSPAAGNGRCVLWSSFLPGSGQFMKGQKVRGGLIAGSELAAIGGIVLCECTRSQYVRKAQEQPRYAVEYSRRADGWKTGRDVCIGAAVGIWAANVLDAAFSRAREDRKYSLGPAVSPEYAGVQLTFRF